MFKKIVLIILLAGFVLIPLISHAAGLVPCGEEGNPCQLCDFFVLVDNVIDFVLIKLVPPLAVLMLVIGGIMFVGATLEFLPGGPTLLSQAKAIMTSVVIGLIIIYGGWIIIGLFLNTIGLSEWTGGTTGIFSNWNQGFFTIPCE
ncbi:hypothetical protein KAU40_01405 [Candidatus Parcubacteria bacterium]|nr:hypothetical protein [Candidatus Parcubacteria bacterium]